MSNLQAYEVFMGTKKLSVLKITCNDLLLRNNIVSSLFLNKSISNWFGSEEEMYGYYENNLGEIFEYQFVIIF